MARAEVEAAVRRKCEVGDAGGAVTVAIRGLGPELLGFLVVVTGNPDDAGEVFAELCVRMWKGLPGFRWESSLRTWSYALARRAAYEHRQRRAAWRDRAVRLSDVPELEALVARVKTTTMAALGQERLSRAQRLRARLDPDDQALLTLRIDRGLEWRDIALVLADGGAGEALGEAAATRAAAALRKRFERIKVNLRRMAAELEQEEVAPAPPRQGRSRSR
jgi:RNA polymerase sigma-70 factor (ECF subfamily)